MTFGGMITYKILKRTGVTQQQHVYVESSHSFGYVRYLINPYSDEFKLPQHSPIHVFSVYACMCLAASCFSPGGVVRSSCLKFSDRDGQTMVWAIFHFY